MMSTPTQPTHGAELLAVDGVVYRVRVTVERLGADGHARHECDWPDWAGSWPGRLAAAQADIARLLEAQADLARRLLLEASARAEAEQGVARLAASWQAAELRALEADATVARLNAAEAGAPLDALPPVVGYACRYGCGHSSPRAQGRAAHERYCPQRPEAKDALAALAAPAPEPSPDEEAAAERAFAEAELTALAPAHGVNLALKPVPAPSAAPEPARAADGAPPAERQARLAALNAKPEGGPFRCPQCNGTAFAESLKRPGICSQCSKATDAGRMAEAPAIAA
jgi:hypothetical protein